MEKTLYKLGRIQDLVTGGSDKRPPALSCCYCCLTSPFFKRKCMVLCFTLGGSIEPPEPPLDPPQINAPLYFTLKRPGSPHGQWFRFSQPELGGIPRSFDASNSA